MEEVAPVNDRPAAQTLSARSGWGKEKRSASSMAYLRLSAKTCTPGVALAGGQRFLCASNAPVAKSGTRCSYNPGSARAFLSAAPAPRRTE